MAAIHGFAPDALEALATAAWPGNVRQLCNVVEQSCALTATPLIPLALVKRALRLPVIEALSYAEAKQRFERNYLVQLLKLTEGNVADAARIATTDVIARWGGDEFVVLSIGHDLQADAVESLVVAALATAGGVSEEVWRPSVSVGVAGIGAGPHRSLDDLLSEADEAMYQRRRQQRSLGS